MSELTKLKYEIEELNNAITSITNSIPAKIAEVFIAENNALDQTLNFVVKSFVSLEIIVIGSELTAMNIYHNNTLLHTTSNKAVALNIDCIGNRKHSLRIVINGKVIESCYVCLTAPKIKKL